MKCLVVSLFLVIEVALGAFERSAGGASVIGMGGVTVALPGNEWAALTNPAALQLIEHRLAALSYTPQQFGLPELVRASVSFVQPTEIGTVAVSAIRFGSTLYREVTLAASYAHTLADRFHAGVTLNYQSLSIQNYGSDAAIACDVGFVARIVDGIHWGFSALNVNAATIGREKERLPQTYQTGVSYQPAGDVTFTADIVKDIRFPAELHVGVGYDVLEFIQIRAGSATEPSSLHAGLGIRYSVVQLDYALASHQVLGLTHHLSLVLDLGD